MVQSDPDAKIENHVQWLKRPLGRTARLAARTVHFPRVLSLLALLAVTPPSLAKTPGDYPAHATSFLRPARIRFSHFIDSHFSLESLLGADRRPLTLLVVAQGRVLAKICGARAWDSREAQKAMGKASVISIHPANRAAPRLVLG